MYSEDLIFLVKGWFQIGGNLLPNKSNPQSTCSRVLYFFDKSSITICGKLDILAATRSLTLYEVFLFKPREEERGERTLTTYE